MSTGALPSGQYGGVTSSVAHLPIAAAPAPAPRLAFAEVYEGHFDLVWRTARRLGVPEDAVDDVVQDAFLVLHRRLDEYDGITPVKAWILGITARVVSEHRRRFRRKQAPCVPHAADSDGNVLLAASNPPPSADVERTERVELLDRLLAQLDEDKREVLVLAQLEEMSAPEIADLLGANLNTVYARLRAARRDFDAAYARHRARNESTRRAP